jgi:hypothetical protein
MASRKRPARTPAPPPRAPAKKRTKAAHEETEEAEREPLTAFATLFFRAAAFKNAPQEVRARIVAMFKSATLESLPQIARISLRLPSLSSSSTEPRAGSRAGPVRVPYSFGRCVDDILAGEDKDAVPAIDIHMSAVREMLDLPERRKFTEETIEALCEAMATDAYTQWFAGLAAHGLAPALQRDLEVLFFWTVVLALTHPSASSGAHGSDDMYGRLRKQDPVAERLPDALGSAFWAFVEAVFDALPGHPFARWAVSEECLWRPSKDTHAPISSPFLP